MTYKELVASLNEKLDEAITFFNSVKGTDQEDAAWEAALIILSKYPSIATSH